EEVAALHEGDHRLAAVEVLVGDGDPARSDDVEGVGLRALLEQHVAPHQVAFPSGGHEAIERGVVEPFEELEPGEQLSVEHDVHPSGPRHVPLRGAVTLLAWEPRARCGASWWPEGRVRGSAGRSSTSSSTASRCST